MRTSGRATLHGVDQGVTVPFALQRTSRPPWKSPPGGHNILIMLFQDPGTSSRFWLRLGRDSDCGTAAHLIGSYKDRCDAHLLAHHPAVYHGCDAGIAARPMDCRGTRHDLTLGRHEFVVEHHRVTNCDRVGGSSHVHAIYAGGWGWRLARRHGPDRKSTRLNSSHQIISYAVFCLKK